MERLDYFIKQGYIYNKITPCKQQEESTSVRGCFLGIVLVLKTVHPIY